MDRFKMWVHNNWVTINIFAMVLMLAGIAIVLSGCRIGLAFG